MGFFQDDENVSRLDVGDGVGSQHCGYAKYHQIVHFQNDEFYVMWIWPQFWNIHNK